MNITPLDLDEPLRALVRSALAEDIGRGDCTTLSLVPAATPGRAEILARGSYVVAGAPVAALVFKTCSPDLWVDILRPDGQAVAADEPILAVAGSAAAILAAERTALNFMQRMTGIATLTRRFVDRVQPYGTLILDTRKTTPGLRRLEKYAVRCGGGTNHRFGLDDRVLIKDNHRRLWAAGGTADLGAAVRQARARYPELQVEIEVESLDELRQALPARPDWVLLDNMAPDRMRACVDLCRGLCRTEASGGIRLENVAAAAATGVDAISLGCLTHSAPAADLSLEFVPE